MSGILEWRLSAVALLPHAEDLASYSCTYMHTYMHTCIHTYMHTYEPLFIALVLLATHVAHVVRLSTNLRVISTLQATIRIRVHKRREPHERIDSCGWQNQRSRHLLRKHCEVSQYDVAEMISFKQELQREVVIRRNTRVRAKW